MGGVEEGKGQKTEKRETMLTKTKKVPEDREERNHANQDQESPNRNETSEGENEEEIIYTHDWSKEEEEESKKDLKPPSIVLREEGKLEITEGGKAPEASVERSPEGDKGRIGRRGATNERTPGNLDGENEEIQGGVTASYDQHGEERGEEQTLQPNGSDRNKNKSGDKKKAHVCKPML
ncbi:hypothetical protein QE152_g11242 [Popillia japonica]|uniref:Uncharacterized protein n=1 Tax=Popillia japonica TaxID=7064 RepID=A0AAW1LSK0_POPJA